MFFSLNSVWEGNTPIRAVFGAMECEIDFLEMFDALEDQPTAKSLILPEESGEQLAQCSSTDVPNVQMRTYSSQLVEVDPFAGTMALRTTSTRTNLSRKQCPKALSWYRHFCRARKKKIILLSRQFWMRWSNCRRNTELESIVWFLM